MTAQKISSMKLPATVVILCTCLVFTTVTTAQVVNIEARRMQTDSVRLKGFAHFAFSYSENDDLNLLVLSGDAGVIWKSKNLKTELLVLGNYATSRSENVNYINALFTHARVTHKISRIVRMEAFQQFQKNPPIGIDRRTLSGVGPRFKILNLDFLSAYLGTHYMFEIEQVVEQNEATTHHRSSSYLSLSLKPASKKIEFITTTYFQPEFGSFADFRVSSDNQLNVNLSKILALTTSFRLFYDSKPPEGIMSRSMNLSQGIKFNF